MSGTSLIMGRLCLLVWQMTRTPGQNKQLISDHVCMEKCLRGKPLPLLSSEYICNIYYLARVAIKISCNKCSFSTQLRVFQNEKLSCLHCF